MNREVFAAVADALERGEPAALVTIVSTTGSTPQRIGAKMLGVRRRPARRYDRRRLATRTTRSGRRARRLRAASRSSCTTSLSDDFAQETGLICGGQMDVYIEPIEPSPELYIVGAGHVGFHLAADRAGSRVPRARGRRPREVRERRALSTAAR